MKKVGFLFLLFCDGGVSNGGFCLFLGTRQEIGERNEPREFPWNPTAAVIFEMTAVGIVSKEQRADIPEGRYALLRANGRAV